MDFCHNISGGLPANYPPEQHLLCSLDDILSGHYMDGDVNMEWLSNFVEDCLSSSGNCMAPVVKPQITTSNAQVTTNTSTQPKPKVKEPNSMLQLVVPCKARSKRKRSPACWLAETGLIFSKKCTTVNSTSAGPADASNGQGQGRKCTHCLSQRTPQWRAGPHGPKTLCNACGVRYKSGRLLPEYRPAKSPTFVTHKHSNSHKKVLEMRMTISPSSTSNFSSSFK
nr:zinc finger, GATA-type [Tanacetum cinerariifolium]